MMMKAVPFLSGYLKKYGGTQVGALLGGSRRASKEMRPARISGGHRPVAAFVAGFRYLL
jgi:hypothetical protein